MTNFSRRVLQPFQPGVWALVGALAAVAGCGAPEAEFKLNRVYTLSQEESSGTKLGDRTQDVADVLAALFGTPDEPHIPSIADVDATAVLDANALKMAAGPVGSDEQGNPRGLYREHCAHCHGVTGDGMGPTAAFLNPYPRDYRKGQYKFKSTPVGSRPTHEDLRKILIDGIPGTAMPSFKLLPADEIEALVQYVKYLSIRGEVERAIVSSTVSELDEKDRVIDLENKDSQDEAKRELYSAQIGLINEAVGTSIAAWTQAAESVTPVEAKPDVTLSQEESIARGREVFYTVANCNKCHGDSALGDGQITDYDEWTKELSPDKPELLAKYLEVGALEPRNIRPRNLRQGIYRGGRRPIDIYWRVINGIEGTPMPGLGPNVLKEGDAPDPKKLTRDDVWHLIEYVRSMPYEPLSQGKEHAPTFQRERN